MMAFPKNEERRARIAELHAQGLNDHQIADELGGSVTAIRKTRAAMGLPAQPRVKPEPKPVPPPMRDVDRFLAACAKAGVVCPRPKNTTNTVRAV